MKLLNGRSRFYGIAVLFSMLCLGPVDASAQTTKDPFAPYTNCKLDDGPAVVETAPLAPGVTSRSVKTILGSESVEIADGRRVMFAYPGEDFYANVKVEFLPERNFEEAKKALVANFEYILASGDNSRNYSLRHNINGFEAQGLDRAKREGGVLGIYLLFDNATRTVITIYFLNQEPPRRFKTMEEYAVVRDHFLNSYTSSIRKALGDHRAD